MKKHYIGFILMLTVVIIYGGCKKEQTRAREEPPQWEMDTSGKYPYTMTAVVTLPFQLKAKIRSDDQLGAFVDGVCRGIGELRQVGGIPVFFVLIHGEAAEQGQVIFEYYSSSAAILYTSYNSLVFSIDGNYGTADDPQVLKLRSR